MKTKKKKVLISTGDGKKKQTLRTTKSVCNVLSHPSVLKSFLIEYHMPPNYTNYLHFPRRRTALAPSFDEIMVHLNYGGDTSVPFVRCRGGIGFVQPASRQSACVYHSKAAVEKLEQQHQQ